MYGIRSYWVGLVCTGLVGCRLRGEIHAVDTNMKADKGLEDSDSVLVKPLSANKVILYKTGI